MKICKGKNTSVSTLFQVFGFSARHRYAREVRLSWTRTRDLKV